jgi:Fe-Mn family superoxide dismutase
MNVMTRRESLGILGAASAFWTRLDAIGGQGGGGGGAQAASPAPAFAGQHEVAPLPFDPKSLKGLSEKLIVSHHDNNYAGAVRNLNKVEQELAKSNADTPAFVVGGLQQSALQFANSKVLHEQYFANLGGDGKSSGAIGDLLTGAYGSLARWEELFRATGMSLGGGSGWVALAYELTSSGVSIVWSGNHTQFRAASAPLLVMDMYEHAYQMDYGAATAKYVDAFFANIHWEEVNRRLERAQKAGAALRG